MKPYTQTHNDNIINRKFTQDIDDSELVWHRDERDRKVTVLQETDWLFQFDNEIPKVVAYADDIACIVNPDNKSFKRKFEQYDLLTSCSGLKLNADKTEIIGSSGLSEIEINYQGQRYILATQEIIKINGLMLSFDTDVMYNQNVSKIYQTIAKQL